MYYYNLFCRDFRYSSDCKILCSKRVALSGVDVVVLDVEVTTCDFAVANYVAQSKVDSVQGRL